VIIENGKIDRRVMVFLKSLLDPESFGYAVSAEVRDEVRALLGMPRVETIASGELGTSINNIVTCHRKMVL
jgi:hypothetical protein